MEEIWKDIQGYEGLYQVSNLGRVKSLDRWVKSVGNSRQFIIGKILRGFVQTQGYVGVVLSKHNKIKYQNVHRLVAQAFIPNPNNLPCVNHKDENKENNHVDNLEWCTQKYNVNYGTGIERCAMAQSKPIKQYTLNGEFVREWESMAEAGRNGFEKRLICMCCKDKHKSHKGYRWEYAS